MFKFMFFRPVLSHLKKSIFPLKNSPIYSVSFQVSEFFQDFDQLRSGSITKSQFRRCLSDFGLSTLGEHDLTDVQFEALATMYQDPKLCDKIMWHKFMWDIESGESEIRDYVERVCVGR